MESFDAGGVPAHGAIGRRVARRALHPLRRGVFAVGHLRLPRHGYWMAAVLAAGPGAVLSHRSAAALWGIRDTARADIDVIAPAERRRPGIDVHRIVLPADEVTVARGIPVTTPAARSSTSPHSPSPPSSHATRDAGERRH